MFVVHNYVCGLPHFMVHETTDRNHVKNNVGWVYIIDSSYGQRNTFYVSDERNNVYLLHSSPKNRSVFQGPQIK